MAKIFQIDLPVIATVYIRAESPADAHAKLNAFYEGNDLLGIEVAEAGDCEFPISGRRFDDPRLPDVSLSPAMSVYRPENPAELPMESDGQEDEE